MAKIGTKQPSHMTVNGETLPTLPQSSPRCRQEKCHRWRDAIGEPSETAEKFSKCLLYLKMIGLWGKLPLIQVSWFILKDDKQLYECSVENMVMPPIVRSIHIDPCVSIFNASKFPLGQI